MLITEVTEINAEIVDAFQQLIPQLADWLDPPTWAELAEIIASPATTILLARDPALDNRIVATLTLVLYRTPTGMHAWIEDVVVDASARGRGIGAALNQEAIRRARAAGASAVDLTSRPSRVEANRLYRRLGFLQRDTHVYRYTPD
jgi:ribosomal protein S18 acetylase RimI-like enzyme